MDTTGGGGQGCAVCHRQLALRAPAVSVLGSCFIESTKSVGNPAPSWREAAHMEKAGGGGLPLKTEEVEVINPQSLKMRMKTDGASRFSKCQTTLAEAGTLFIFNLIFCNELSNFSIYRSLGSCLSYFLFKEHCNWLKSKVEIQTDRIYLPALLSAELHNKLCFIDSSQ